MLFNVKQKAPDRKRKRVSKTLRKTKGKRDKQIVKHRRAEKK